MSNPCENSVITFLLKNQLTYHKSIIDLGNTTLSFVVQNAVMLLRYRFNYCQSLRNYYLDL